MAFSTKENQIFLRQLKMKKVQSSLNRKDRLFLTLISTLSNKASKHLIIVTPSTLLSRKRRFIKKFWTYKQKEQGRKPVSKEIKLLILEMKQENQLWGCYRIADELKKLRIDLNPTTVNRIIQTFRKQGKIHPNGSWKKFLKAHWQSF